MRKSLGDKRREIPLDASAGYPEDPRGLQGRRYAEARRSTARRKRSSSAASSRRPQLRLPQDHASSGRCGSTSRPAPSGSRAWRRRRPSRRLAQSKKKGAAGAKEEAEGRAQQEAIRKLLRALPASSIKRPRGVRAPLDAAAKKAGLKLAAPSARRSSPPSPSGTRRPRSAATRTAIPSPTRSSATPRACRCREDVRGLLRPRGEAPRPRRLDR